MTRYHGVKDAARRVHDSYIGVGSVFHLFRLPEEIERALHSLAESAESIKIAQELSDKSAVLARLHGDKPAPLPRAEGPGLIGPIADVFSAGGLGQVSERYGNAFLSGTKVYPYFTAK
jgi:hypothetical protein